MTEKRFKCVSNYDWWGVIDITGEIKGEYDNGCFSTDTVVDLLNSLSEENKQLIEHTTELIALTERFRKDKKKLEEENEQLKETIVVYNATISNFDNLKKENKQLKKRNEFLKKQLDRVCSENEMMGDKLKKIGRIL